MDIIRVDSVSKSYGAVQALDAIQMNVNRGELFGLIGPDGAGKTTLIRMLATLLIPDSGLVTVAGMNVVNDYRKVRNILGYMPGQFSLYHDLSVEENLKFFAGIFGTTVQANYHLIRDIYGMLEPFKDRPAGKLSGGMKQKLALSCALIHRPEVLILDEPTTGVDAVSRKEFWELLRKLKGEGITIFVSTAYMDEASLCDRVALIQKGKILGVNNPTKFAQDYPFKLFSIAFDGIALMLDKIRAFPSCTGLYLFGSVLHFSSGNPGETAESIASQLTLLGVENTVVEPVEAGIEDCFIQMMNG
ncbi:MAG: ABC transporter ATP-binding protein [Bacteroidales bacterium]